MMSRIPGGFAPTTDLYRAPHDQAPNRSPSADSRRKLPDQPDLPPERPRARLPRPGANAAQPVPHLLWPDGRQSAGQVFETPAGLMFEPASIRDDPVLAQRGQGKPTRRRSGPITALPVTALPETPAGRQFVPQLPQILADHDLQADGSFRLDLHRYYAFLADAALSDPPVGMYLQAPDAKVLANIVQVAGASGSPGLRPREDAAVTHLFGRILDAVAAQCQDPQAVRNVAQALLVEPIDELQLVGVQTTDPGLEPGFSAAASFDAAAACARLAALRPGQIWRVRICQYAPEFANVHDLDMNMQAQADGRMRLSVINSNGWSRETHNRPRDTLALFKTLSVDHTVAALQDLLSGRIPNRPATIPRHIWTTSGAGAPLREWLTHAGPADTRLSTDFHGTGESLRSSGQKHSDCAMESLFAFMASAMPPVDYKLAKAVCLNTLVQIVDRLEPPATAASNSPLQAARRRLQERITTSLGGHMVAPETPSR